LKSLFIGNTVHICCGKSLLGDVRVDNDAENNPDILCDAANMSSFIKDNEFDTVLCDPPYNGKFRWNHNLLAELSRIASKRIIFQHWFIPANKYGLYKKAQEKFKLTELYCWQPRTYFGRVQMITVFDIIN
jgi:DNA modification methylase